MVAAVDSWDKRGESRAAGEEDCQLVEEEQAG